MPLYFVFALGFLMMAIAWASRVVLPLYALEFGAEPFTIGLLAAAFAVLPMLLSVPAGKLADRFGARWLLIFSALGGGLGMLLSYFVPGLPAIFVASALVGLSLGIYTVLLQNLVGLLSTPLTRARNFSNYALIASVSSFSGPLIAGFSIDFSGNAMACLYLALLTLLPVAMLLIRGSALRGGVRPDTDAAGGGVRAMLSEPGVRRVLATSSMLNTGRDLYRFYLPVYAHSIGLSASIIGIVLAMNAAAEFIVRLVLPRLIARFKEEKVLAYAFYVGAASLIMVPFFKDAAMLGLITFMFGLGMGCGQPIITMLMFSNSAKGRSGEAMGLRMTVIHLTRLIGPVMFGAIGSAFGLPPMFWVNALMMGAGGILSRPKST